MFSGNITQTENFIITDTISSLSNKEIENSIINISKKLPDKNTTINLINDTKTKNWREYINYDTYIYHTKYDTYNNEIYNNMKYNFDGYSNLVYIKSCAWLLDECEKIIKNIVNNQKYEYKKIYNQNLELYEYCALINHYDVNYDVMLNWEENKKQLPFNLVKSILEKKGYEIMFSEDNAKFYLEIKLNKKREREQ